MADAVFYLVARSRRLSSAHSRVHSTLCRRLHSTEPWPPRSKLSGKREAFGGYAPVALHRDFNSSSPLFNTFTQKIHTQQAELSASPARFFSFRPFLVMFRAAYIMAEVTMLSAWHFVLSDTQKRAEKLRRCLIRLGPFYIKIDKTTYFAYLIHVKEKDESESSNLSSLDVSQHAFLDEYADFSEALLGQVVSNLLCEL
ncbi:hypothetical protein L7F22_005850 [Adiantum nelumboides]|nr:hypothetical protein [Adiantum nelumboides]